MLLFPVVVLGYFAIAWAVLRVFTSWDTRELLIRAGVLAVVCNAPLLIGGAIGLVIYLLVGVAAMRVLIARYDLSFTAAVLPIAGGAVVSICAAMAVM